MKATLSFSIPQEQEEFELAQNGGKYKAVLKILDNWLRSKLKHEDLPEQEDKTMNSVRNKLHELLNEEEISLF